MNIFKSLFGKVFHDPNAAEVVKISTGQLYLVRPGNIRSSRECIYNEAMATIRRVPSVEHNFQLVITRVYEDGDQELLDDEDETDEERVFLVSEELEFRTGETEGEPTLIWRDLDGDIDEFYEFVASGTNEPTRAFFETCMYRAMYERKFRKSSDDTQDAELDQFIWRPPSTRKGRGKAKEKVALQTPDTDLSDAMNNLSVMGSSTRRQSGGSEPLSSKPSRARTSFSSASLPALVAEEAMLHCWDIDTEQFVVVHEDPVVAKIVEKSTDEFDYWLMAYTDDGDLLAHEIKSEMNALWQVETLSMAWNSVSERGTVSSWAFAFSSREGYEAFKKIYTRVSWEVLHGMSWNKINADEQAYVMRARNDGDVEMKDVQDENEEEEEVESELDPEEEPSDSEGEEESEDLPPALERGERNSQLTVGYKGDRSYVVRGNNIGVFSHSGDNQVKYYATISRIATPKGKEFKPKQVMLHDQDSKMILMNPAEPNSLFNMDIERGKVVEEWKVHDDINVDHITPDTKFAQMTPQQTLVGVSHNALFRIDPRISGKKMVESQLKQYVTKNKFSGVATTESGKLAVASEKGDIRLFDSIGKNAKTALPPLGDAIVGIDVTASGRWIVATTKTYLLLIDTLIGEGRYAGNLGFDRSFPAAAKPMPRRLQLRPEHVAYMNHEISFTPARFNQGEGQDENAIITSTGQYVVAWDFAKVKRGQLDKYEIKKYEDQVVQDNFKFGDDKEIIVALQNNVLAINKKNLKRPTRTSLAPASDLRSKSNIVNSPY